MVSGDIFIRYRKKSRMAVLFSRFDLRFDIELGAGIGVQFYGMSLELGYDWGLLNLQKYERKNFSTRRNQINVTLGYAF